MRLASLLLLVFSFNVLQAGFVDPTPNITPISKLKEVQDDHWIIIEGYIVKQLDKDTYLFRDRNHDVKIEIDEDVWQGRDVTPKTRIRLYGEMDQSDQDLLVDVKKIILIPKD